MEESLSETRVKVKLKVASLPETRVKVTGGIITWDEGKGETEGGIITQDQGEGETGGIITWDEGKGETEGGIITWEVAPLPETRVKVRQKVVAEAGSLSPGAAEMSTWKRTLRENMDEPPPRRYSARNVDVDTTLWLRSGVWNV